MRTKCLLIPKPLPQSEYDRIIEEHKKRGWQQSGETEEMIIDANISYYLFTFTKDEFDVSTT